MLGFSCAYMRCYYPIEFLTAYLSCADTLKDINKGTKLAEILKVKISSVKFGKSLASYTFDKAENIIYKGAGGIKFLNDKVADELYSLSQNNKFTFIPNGEIGIIKNISDQGIETPFENAVIYQKEDMKNLKLAYSISVHKSQGRRAKIVILITSSCYAFMLRLNLLYVGITRAAEKVYHLGDVQTVNRAVHKKMDFKREISLINMLKESN